MPGDPNEDPFYEKVSRMVLEGHKREDVYRSMAMYGITGDEADGLFESAWRERSGILSARASGRLFRGLVLMFGAAGTGAFASMPPEGIYLISAGMLFGAWQVRAGLRDRRRAMESKGRVRDWPRIYPGGHFP